MRGMLLERSAARLEMSSALQRRDLALAGRPLAYAAPAAGQQPQFSSLDEAGVLEALERHDAGVRRRLTQALAADTLSPGSRNLVRSAVATVIHDHRQVRELNLILH